MTRTIFGVLLALMLLAVAGNGQSMNDPYSLNLVSSELKVNAAGRRIVRSWAQKGLVLLGDGVSVALLKLLDDSDLKNPEKVRDFLPIIRDAFRQPQSIAIEADKKPQVTTFLLNYVRQNISDAQVQSEIQQTMDFIEKKTEE